MRNVLMQLGPIPIVPMGMGVYDGVPELFNFPFVVADLMRHSTAQKVHDGRDIL